MRRWGLSDFRPLARRLQRAGLVVALLSAACFEVAVAEETRQVKFGALMLSYDAQTWSVTSGESGFTAECTVRRCLGRIVTGRVLPDSRCGADELGPGAGRVSSDWRAAGTAPGDLHWLVARWWRGCRNAHPESLAACTLHAGAAYRIDAPLLTCRTAPQSEVIATILSLIGGISTEIR